MSQYPAILRSETTKSILLAVLTGIFAATFSLSPQINLWRANGWNFNGVYATHDMDEAAYAAYVQSLIDGKPRRNSPYSGVEDSPETPLKESLFSIQVVASYPIATIARVFGLSSSGAFILASALFGFLTGLAVFWLFLILFKNPFLAFAGGVVVLAAGALAAGQGNLLRPYTPIYYGITFPFARRIVPLAGFPFLFLFFGGVWMVLQTEEIRRRVLYMIGTLVAFVVLVYSYFYLWTTAFAWLGGLGLLLVVFRPEKYRAQLIVLALLAGGMVLALVPYIFLIANRAESTDSVQLLEYTRMPDLTRIPELISILVAIGFGILAVTGRINLKETRSVFLVSFAIVAVIVFNQQVITGRSLQPVHYQFFAVNYTALFALISLLFLLLTESAPKYLSKCLLLLAVVGFYVGYREITEQASMDVLRDNIVPVATKIREISKSDSDTVLAFDLAGHGWPASDELPALSSRPVLWALHQRVFADVSAEESLERFFCFLYLQNKNEAWLREQLVNETPSIVHGVYGWSRSDSDVLSGKNPITGLEIEQYVDLYKNFALGFDATKAGEYPIAYVVAHELAKDTFGNFDKHYEREPIGHFKPYVLYATRLRRQIGR